MPGGTTCGVAGCKRNSKFPKENEKLRFFSFPSTPQICQEWVRRCNKKDLFSVKSKRICSRHFLPEDYEDFLKANLLKITPKKLKKTAVPSLFLLASEGQQESVSVPLEKNNKSADNTKEDLLIQEQEVENGIVEHDKDLNKEAVPEQLTEAQVFEKKYRLIQTENDILRNKLKKLQTGNDILRDKLEGLQAENDALKKNNNDFKNNRIAELEQEIEQSNSSFEKRAKELFKDFVSSNQVDIVLKRKKKVRWTNEELSKAFTLRYLGKRSYVYLRETLKYPLPSISTLQRWAGNINLRSGMLNDILRVMETVARDKNEFQRTTVLSFDEVKVSSLLEYDQKEDEIVGPHSYMQIIMARGLFDKWKQPIYIGFDQKMTKELLETAITKLHNIKYNVVACVSDCGAGNQGLWKALDININKTYHDHPVTKEPVYFFADVPHLLKLLRNWFIDTGFILNDGTSLNKIPVQKLIEHSGSEISSCHKLKNLHINCFKTERQNVRLAAELFSNTTATALQYYKFGENETQAKNVGKFTELVNNWFDIMNSYTPTASVPTKMPYGLDLEKQDEILQEMISTIGGMLCDGKTSLQVFQKGIIISTTSLQHLYLHVKEKLKATYILTHRLNQDCLENFFSQLRTRGGLHDHPSPLNALYRIRMILLGKNPGLVQKNTNVDSNIIRDEEAEFLLSSALKKAKIDNVQIETTQCSVGTEATNSSSLIVERISSSSTISSTDSSPKSQGRMVERDGLSYIAGYLAKKFLKTHPYLGKYTYQGEIINVHSYNMPSWIQSLSFGGLIQPSQEWTTQIEKMESYFLKYHKDSFYTKKNVVDNTLKYISAKVRKLNISKELIHSFCKLRHFVRIKYLNSKKEDNTQASKRKYSKMPGEPQKLAKKMRKIVQ